MKPQKNLKILFEKVYNYDIHVATIKFNQLVVKLGDWSNETIKYINYVASKLNLKIKNGTKSKDDTVHK